MKEKRAPAKSRSTSVNKSKYAQYFTPSVVADFMVGMFADDRQTQATILDPGAGEGILGLSLAERLSSQGIEVSTTLIEVDAQVFQTLKSNAKSSSDNQITSLINGDFLKEGFNCLNEGKSFSHVIMNPPYFKLQRDSAVSGYLMSGGINATNIYVAFMWLGLKLLSDNGQLVAIVPRSFCNGPYFLKFREYLAEHVSIEAMHTFNSRDKVFSKDQVLQENLIIRFAKKPQAETVTVTYSADQRFSDVQEAKFTSTEIIHTTELDSTICIPPYLTTAKLTDFTGYALSDTGLQVSTGPVVDFRQKEFISNENSAGSVPLLYPAHMKDGQIVWPIDNLPKKGQYYSPRSSLLDGIDAALGGDKNILPANGYYVVIRRFSSKEERRRIYASVVDPAIHPYGIAFENHLNYFHVKKQGFDKELAYGLSAYLSSSLVDEHFRTFSGHTQVNATDLRNLPYPSKLQLRGIGRIALEAAAPIETVVTEEVLRECA